MRGNCLNATERFFRKSCVVHFGHFLHGYKAQLTAPWVRSLVLRGVNGTACLYGMAAPRNTRIRKRTKSKSQKTLILWGVSDGDPSRNRTT
jgi:hypothetical protein